MTARHTPGPWEVRDDGIYSATARPDWAEGLEDFQGERVRIICSTGACGGDDAAADLALMAAAPAMLAALQLAEGWIDAEREGEETGEGQQARWILDTIRAAIAAATGGATGEAEAPAASPTDEPADDGEAIRTLEQAAACVRDGLVLLDTVDYVDDHALEDGQLCVVPAEGPAFNIAITMQPY